jgi:hypothetical protein
MWERALGIRSQRCLPAGTLRGIVGLGPKALLMRAGQPQRRVGRTFSYCVRGGSGGTGRAVAMFGAGGKVRRVALPLIEGSAGS